MQAKKIYCVTNIFSLFFGSCFKKHKHTPKRWGLHHRPRKMTGYLATITWNLYSASSLLEIALGKGSSRQVWNFGGLPNTPSTSPVNQGPYK